jgi:transcription initiation factor TFIIIB Brf1 subunit/transcription initiation factor TFIIB
MYCRICGTDQKVEYQRSKGMNLCTECGVGMPKKASYSGFTKRYWSEPALVSERVKREFYDDYKTSLHTVQEYINATSSWIFDD